MKAVARGIADRLRGLALHGVPVGWNDSDLLNDAASLIDNGPRLHTAWMVQCGQTGIAWGPFDTIIEAEREAKKLNQPVIRPINPPGSGISFYWE